MRKRKNVNKKILKKTSKCKICGENDYTVLDVHRILNGCDGGKYTISNSVICCCKCHRKIHANKIQILKWVNSTAGRKLYIIDEDGNEQFL